MAKMKYDNPVFEVINTIVDCFLVGLLWIFTSLPIFTIGASSCALYSTLDKVTVHKTGYLFKEYMESFKANFKQATLTWLIFLVLFLVLGYDLIYMKTALSQGLQLGVMYYFFMVVTAVALAWAFYTFPYTARFEGTIRDCLFKSFAMMIVNIGWSVLLVAIAYALFAFCNDLQFFFFLLPGGFGYLQHIILERVFKKYRTPEDIARERERYDARY